MPKEKKSVLFLSYDGLTDPLGQSQILPYLCGLSGSGYQITIVSFEKVNAFKKNRPLIAKICTDHGLTWHPLEYHKKPPVISTLYDLWNLQRTIRNLKRKQNFDIVHCRSYLTAIIGKWAKYKFRCKFIFDMRGFWADERIEGGIWKLSNPLYRYIYNYFKKQESVLLRTADKVIVLTSNAKTQIELWGVPASKLVVIPCCVDTDHFDPKKVRDEDKRQLRLELGIKPDDFVLLYLGSLGTWYLYDEMMKFFEAVKAAYPRSKFMLITPDQHAVAPGADVIVKTLPRSDVPRYVSICNASVCFIKPVFSKKGSSATKMGEVLSMNVPVFSNAGWGDIETLYAECSYLIVDLHLPFTVQLNLDSKAFPYRKLALEFFDLQKGIEKYREVYDTLTSDKYCEVL